jgi:two-component system, sporulation sensor kinase E
MKSAFLDKLIERMDRVDPESLQSHFLHLAQEKGLMEAIFQSIQEGILLIDGQGRMSYANRAAEQFLGFRLEKVRNRPIQRYLPEIDWDRVLALDAAEWTRMVSYEIEVRYPEHRFLSFYVVPLVAVNSTEKGAVVLLRDVTRDRENSVTQIESERINAIRLLAAGVAHEVGNPLNALTIHLQLLARQISRLPEDHRQPLVELMEVAQNEVSRLDLIITKFLKAIRPSTPSLAPADPAALIQETLAILKTEIENRQIRVAIDCPEPLPVLKLDKDQMKQAFFNVIKNGIQSMRDGGLLTLTLHVTGDFVNISVRDTGTGIRPEDFGHIFEPYYTTKTSGTGLGLMIVQRIVQEHGGKILIESAPDAGTTVTIRLPVDERRVRLLKAAHVTSAKEQEPTP